MPLLFDMPLEELKDYGGTNPRPDDFDAYWDVGLDEMRATASEPERVLADFQVPFAICEHLYFTGVGGARIHAKLVRPRKTSSPSPAILEFHGYGGNSKDWVEKLSWAAMGYTIATLDCRGQGGLSEDVGGVSGTTLRGHIIRGLEGPPEQMLFRQIFLDTAQLARIVMDMEWVDENRVGAMGGSQGGGLTLACAALEPRIARAAPFVPFLTDYQRVWELDLAKDAYFELKQYFRSFDPLHKREDSIFTQLGYIDVQHLAPRIRAEVLQTTGLMDTICPPSTQFAAYNKITSKKRMTIYPDFGHEDLPRRADEVFQFMSHL